MIISPAKAAEAAGVLGVKLDELTHDSLKSAYKGKAKECHPDHHGNAKLEMWSKVSWANDCLKHWLQTHRDIPHHEPEVALGDCRACGGTGRVNVVKRGFGAPLTMGCVMCRGLGSITPEENDGD